MKISSVTYPESHCIIAMASRGKGQAAAGTSLGTPCILPQGGDAVPGAPDLVLFLHHAADTGRRHLGAIGDIHQPTQYTIQNTKYAQWCSGAHGRNGRARQDRGEPARGHRRAPTVAVKSRLVGAKAATMPPCHQDKSPLASTPDSMLVDSMFNCWWPGIPRSVRSPSPPVPQHLAGSFPHRQVLAQPGLSVCQSRLGCFSVKPSMWVASTMASRPISTVPVCKSPLSSPQSHRLSSASGSSAARTMPPISLSYGVRGSDGARRLSP